MSIAIKPELTVAAPASEEKKIIIVSKPDFDSMMDSMEAEIVKYYESVEGSVGRRNGIALRARWDMRDYIKRSIDEHITLIERFGGWRWHSRIDGEVPLNEDDLSKVIQETVQEFARGAVLYANSKTRAAEKLPPLQLKTWATEAERFWCRTFDCCLPAPAVNTKLWRGRVFDPGNGEKESIIEVASDFKVKIRLGQAPTRAVLAEVKKRYAEKPVYVSMWERLIERLGVAWSTATPTQVTLSAAPVDFLRCGHYNEGGSCYQTGGAHEHSKLNLSVIKNSMMALFYRNEDLTVQTHPNTLRRALPDARCWAVSDPENHGAVFSNLYRLSWAQVTPAIQEGLRQAFGWETLIGAYGDALRNTDGSQFYTNSDGKLFYEKDWQIKAQKGIQHNVQGLKREKKEHIKMSCNCGFITTNPDDFITCSCTRKSCKKCSIKTDCCGTQACAHCRGTPIKCAGTCGKTFCRTCMGKNKGGTTCIDTGAWFCGEDAAARLKTCSSCARMTSRPHACGIDKDNLVCGKCVKAKRRNCNRCKGSFGLKHVTRCSACKQRRCDNCVVEGESTKPKSLCKSCTDKGGVPGDQPLDADDERLLALHKDQLDALPAAVRDEFFDGLRAFKWDADDLTDEEIDGE